MSASIASTVLQYSMEDNLLAERIGLGLTTADRLVPVPMSDYLAWTPDQGWLLWKGTVWESIPEAFAIEGVRERLKQLFRDIAAQPDITPESVKVASRLLTATKAKNVSYFLKGILYVASEEWDSHPDLLNCQNGVLNLKTGVLTEHDPTLRLTKITSVPFRRGAEHPDWTTALEAIPYDVQRWLQVRYGQGITGYPVDDDVLPIQSGGGKNGKSTLVNAIVGAAGSYGVFVPEKVLLANTNEHPTELMTLRGARLAVIEETPEGKHLPTKRLKDLVGTPIMTARYMRQDFVSWSTTHSLFLNTNYVPQVSETDHGTWRRLALVKFPYKFVDPADPLMGPDEKYGDPGLRERLRFNEDGQLEAVLAWLVAGAQDWYGRAGQYPTPLTVKADTAAWRAETDLILAYAIDRLSFDANSKVLSKELLEDFNLWLESTGHRKWADNLLTQRFGEHELAKNNKVTKERTRDMAGLSRRGYPSSPTPDQASVWYGISFK